MTDTADDSSMIGQALECFELPPELLWVSTPDLPPPVESRLHELPLRSQGWAGFERLMVAVVRDVLSWQDVRQYGVRGQKQHGIDLLGYVATANQTEVRSCQCKDVESFSESDLRETVELFANGKRPLGSAWIAIAVSCNTDDTKTIEELHRLREKHHDLTIELWGARQLDAMLENQHSIVRKFFGPEWTRVFCTPLGCSRETGFSEYLSRAARLSRDRLLTRWLAAGVRGDVAIQMVEDSLVGHSGVVIEGAVKRPLTVIEGDFGSGKSVTAERIHQLDLAEAQAGQSVLPVYFDAREVKEGLGRACLRIADSLDLGADINYRIIVDGIDEVGPVIAEDLLNAARAFILTRPNSRIVVTARPGLRLRTEECVRQPLLSENQAYELFDRVGGARQTLYDVQPAVADALRRPLFALIAADLQQADWAIPQNSGKFLDAMVNRALEKSRLFSVDVQESLEKLAELLIVYSSPVPAVEVGTDELVRALLETRLVVRRQRILVFALPILEQYFAGRAALRPSLIDTYIDDLTILERWRYGLVLAVTIGSWDRSSSLLDKLTRHHSGLAAWVVANAIQTYSDDRGVNLPGDSQTAQRLFHAYDSWTAGIQELSEHFSLRSGEGLKVAVEASVDGAHLVAGVLRDPAGPRFRPMRTPVDIFHPRPEWCHMKMSSVAADEVAWPWLWTLEWIQGTIGNALKRRSIPLSRNSPGSVELCWKLARAICEETGQARHNPLSLKKIKERAYAVLDFMERNDTGQARIRHSTVINRYQIGFLLEYLERHSDQEYLHRPYVLPDRLDTHEIRWIWDIYSPDAMLTLCNQVLSAAISIYEEIVLTWFPRVVPTLGLGSLLPVRLRGILSLSESDGFEGAPTVEYGRFALPRSEASAVDISFGELPPYDDNSLGRRVRSAMLLHRPEAVVWAKRSCYSGDFEGFGDRPATNIAYNWLQDDLHELQLTQFIGTSVDD